MAVSIQSRRERVHTLRDSGVSWGDISKLVGVPVSTCRHDYMHLVTGPVDTTDAEHDVDQIYATHFRKATVDGSPQSANICLRILADKRRALLEAMPQPGRGRVGDFEEEPPEYRPEG